MVRNQYVEPFKVRKIATRPYEYTDEEMVKISITIERDLNLYLIQVRQQGIVGLLVNLGGLSYAVISISAMVLSL